PNPLRQRGSQAPCPPPATVSAEGRLIKGGPFPASATAEGAQLNVPPSFWERVRGSQYALTRAVEVGERRIVCHLIHKPSKSWSNSPPWAFPHRTQYPQSKPASTPRHAPGLPGQRSPGSNNAISPAPALLF